MESCRYMYESPMTMMNSLHKHAVTQIEKYNTHRLTIHDNVCKYIDVMSRDGSYDSNVL